MSKTLTISSLSRLEYLILKYLILLKKTILKIYSQKLKNPLFQSKSTVASRQAFPQTVFFENYVSRLNLVQT